MQYMIIIICVLIIVYSVIILGKNIYRMSKGKCCEGCSGCASKHMCELSDCKNNCISSNNESGNKNE